jgi:hypothetical protein
MLLIVCLIEQKNKNEKDPIATRLLGQSDLEELGCRCG